MKRGFIIAIFILPIVLLAILMLIPEESGAEPPVPPEAWDIAKMIQKKSVKHSALTKNLAPIQAELAKLELERDAIVEDMSKVAGGAAGLDHTLCSEYGLRYIRGEGDNIGKFVETTDCPLE